MSPVSAKTYTTEVICLRAIEFGEADKILHLYSPEHGRISAFAKGVKKPKSKMAGACEPLTVSEVQLAHGKSLETLCQYQPRKTFVGIRSDLLKLAYGQLFAELVGLSGGEADSQDIYHLLKNALHLLDEADPAQPEAEILPLAIEFQVALLHAAGYHPELTDCILTGEPLALPPVTAIPSGESPKNPAEPDIYSNDSASESGPIEPLVYFCFSPQLGGFTTPERKRRHQAEAAASSLRSDFPEGRPQRVEWVNVSPDTLRLESAPHETAWPAPRLLKAQRFLQYYLQHILEKPLHTYPLVFNLLEVLGSEKSQREQVPVQQA